MSDAAEALARIDALIQVGVRLAQSTTGGRIALAKVADNLDPSWIPAGQPRLATTLESAAQARPEPLGLAEVESILTGAWKVRRVGDELDSLDPEPVAVTLTSQVHRARHDGSPVAVKVLRPGLAGAVRQDLALLDGLLAPLAGAFPRLDPAALLAEIRERAMDEFDLEHEAAMMRRFSRALRGGPVAVPVPVTDLCHEGVLVSSWLDGESLAAAVGFGHDSSAAALLQFVIGGIREGLVHCDLDLRDVLVLADGRLGVVDFGAVGVVGRDRADACLAVVSAFADADAAAFDDALAGLGVLTPGHGEMALSVATQVLGELGEAGESALDVDSLGAALARLAALGPDAVELLLAGRLVPGDLYPARGIAQLFSVIARIGARGAWREQVSTALRTGWHG